MARKIDGTAEATEQLSMMLPVALKKRLKIAAINADKTVTALVVELIEGGLDRLEKKMK